MTTLAQLIGFMKSRFLGVALSLLFAVGACAAPLVVGYSSVTSVFLPFWIGNEAGFYKKEGLDIRGIRLPCGLICHWPCTAVRAPVSASTCTIPS
jgi:hypothetical protein